MNRSLRRGSLVATLFAVVASTPLRAQQPAQWLLDSQPALTLGSEEVEPGALLQVIVFATRLADGSIIVGDRGDHALKHFDNAGRFIRASARNGSGPGEVRYLGAMFRCGDSLYTYDIEEGHRMSVFALDGRYRRAFRWQAPPGQSVPYVSACNSAGTFVHVGWPDRAAARPGIYRSNVAVWMSRGDSTAPQMLDSIAGSERWGMVADGRFVGSRPLPLGKQPVVAMGRARALVGSADRFMVNAFALDGQLLKPIERATAPARVAKSDVRDLIEREVANVGEDRRARVEAGYAEITFPATLPAYTHALVDSEDFLWIRPFPRGTGDMVRWSVFTASGAFAGEVAVPRELQVYEVGRDYVLGRFMDPTEALPQVRLYRLRRPAKDAPDIRDDAKRLIDQLPARAGWDDLAYEVYVRQAVEQGLADAAAGRTVDHETALARVRARIRRPA